MRLMQLSFVILMVAGWATATDSDVIDNNTIDEEAEEEDDVPPEVKAYFDKVNWILEKARGVPSKETGKLVAKYNPSVDLVNPEELGSYYQGDILYNTKTSGARNGLVNLSSRWPGGNIPYVISTNFSLIGKSKILAAMNQYHRNIPCMKFIERVRQTDYIFISRTATGCWSYVGRIGGRQDVNVQDPGCMSSGTIIHELMHAAGFLHEQSREDRDEHVEILWENILPGAESNFDKAAAGLTTYFGVPYTYESVMHYSAYAFSKNGEKTILGKPDENVTMGQRTGFHANDIKKLRAMYGCPEVLPETTEVLPETTTV